MPPPTSKRTKLMNRVQARFQGIRADLEPTVYNTNVGKHVFYFRTGTISEEELEGFDGDVALIIRDIDEIKFTDGEPNKKVISMHEAFGRDLHVQVELIGSGTNAPLELHKLIADVETAIGKDVRWKDEVGSALAIGTRPRIDRSVVEQESKKIGGVIYEFFIYYKTGAFNPYA